jgi:hypothetical protein
MDCSKEFPGFLSWTSFPFSAFTCSSYHCRLSNSCYVLLQSFSLSWSFFPLHVFGSCFIPVTLLGFLQITVILTGCFFRYEIRAGNPWLSDFACYSRTLRLSFLPTSRDSGTKCLSGSDAISLGSSFSFR